MTRMFLRAAVLALVLAGAPALGQQGAGPPGRSGPDKPRQDQLGQDRSGSDGSAPLIGCPSLANYRLLMRGGAPAAAAVLADPKADHLGCAVLPRGRITGIADRVMLGGRSYDCAGMQGTTACHWIASGMSITASSARGAVGR